MFEFKWGDAAGLGFVRDGKFTYFEQDGDLFKGRIRPGKGVLRVAVRFPDSGKRYSGVLEYEVE